MPPLKKKKEGKEEREVSGTFSTSIALAPNPGKRGTSPALWGGKNPSTVCRKDPEEERKERGGTPGDTLPEKYSVNLSPEERDDSCEKRRKGRGFTSF